MRDILNRIVGRTLTGATEARHWVDGVRGTGDDALMDCWLHFAGEPPLHLCGDDTGTRLEVTFDEPYTSYDLGPRGEFRVEPPTPNDVLSRYVGCRLIAAVPVGGGGGLLLRFRDESGAQVGGTGEPATDSDLFVACVDDDLVLRRVDAAPPTMGEPPPASRATSEPA